jgi:hypothetical protein
MLFNRRILTHLNRVPLSNRIYLFNGQLETNLILPHINIFTEQFMHKIRVMKLKIILFDALFCVALIAKAAETLLN